jgi:RNA polymerase primary sigma factor
MKAGGTDEQARIAAVLAGDTAVLARFLNDISDTVWTSCCLLAGEGPEAREAFTDVLAALRVNDFARLKAYSGRGTIDTFIAMTVRDLLAERMLRLLQADRTRGWAAFQRFFEADIVRLIRRRLPDAAYEETRRDVYQDICVALIEGDYRRLKAYAGNGSFAGFVLRTVDRLVTDLIRSLTSRRRLPAAVARLAPLDQEIYKLVFWRRVPARADALLSALGSRVEPVPSQADIEGVLEHLRLLTVNGLEAARTRMVSLSSLDPDVADQWVGPEASPEDNLTHRENEEHLAQALEVLKIASAALPEAERLYLSIVLSGTGSPPAREIARLMQRPVEEVYKLKQRVMKRLHDAIMEDSAVKTWRAAV